MNECITFHISFLCHTFVSVFNTLQKRCKCCHLYCKTAMVAMLSFCCHNVTVISRLHSDCPMLGQARVAQHGILGLGKHSQLGPSSYTTDISQCKYSLKTPSAPVYYHLSVPQRPHKQYKIQSTENELENIWFSII